MKLFALLLAALSGSGDLHAACYTVFTGRDIVYQSMVAPVDTSQPYSTTVPSRFGPGATMMVSQDDPLCSGVLDRTITQRGDAMPATVVQGGTIKRTSTTTSTGAAAKAPWPLQDLDNFFQGQEARQDSTGVLGRGGDGLVHTGQGGGRYPVTSGGTKSSVSGGARRR